MIKNRAAIRKLRKTGAIQMTEFSERLLAHRMVDEQLRPRGIHDEAVLQAMEHVPRHRFVPNTEMQLAYSDKPLPTAEGQTISQPYMVAIMTQHLQVQPWVRSLEVGTGSGYQAAVLAEMGANVITMERSPVLVQHARRVLAELGYSDRVQVVEGDGTLGWPADAPYDRILAAAAAPHVPNALREQLADGGRIVIPIGTSREQHLLVGVRHGAQWIEHTSTPCRFVPLIGADGWQLSDWERTESDRHDPHP
jgi:protein-L-isoaspartate(D-aspartate) O-methyltransferase